MPTFTVVATQFVTHRSGAVCSMCPSDPSVAHFRQLSWGCGDRIRLGAGRGPAAGDLPPRSWSRGDALHEVAVTA
jgi:hypothetical protein